MKNKFIIDKEINLNEQDYLKTKVYADNLTEIIKNTEPNKVFTVGLFGSWGTGKSSIIETSKQELEQENKKVKFITYDAWQYVNDSFRRMFLRKLREDLNYEEKDLMKKFYENESTDIGNKYQLSPTRMGFIIGGLIVLLAILTCIPFDLDYKFSVYAIFTLLGLLITIISGAFHQLKISVTKPHLFAPEQFEECFKEIVSNSLQKNNKALKWITGNNSIQNLEKLVIVIDNIDRCSNDIAYDLLTNIKTFLSSEKYSIVFIIPVDDEALRKHILGKANEENCNKEKEEFLRKFFNVTIRIKSYGETDMFSFAKQINDEYNLNFKKETINIVSKEFAKNPRRVIQLFNNLLVELNLVELNYDYDVPEFAQKNEILICCILIIREEYPDYYESIINYPKLFIDGSVPENTPSGKEIKNIEEINRFIGITRYALGKIDINDLSRVLTNSYNQFNDIPADLKNSIEAFDKEKVLTNWDSYKERIIDFIIDRLNNALKNQLVDTDLVAYFDLVTEINKQYLLDNHYANRIDEKVVPYLSTIISETEKCENLCNYAFNRNNQGNNTIKKALIEDAKRSKDQKKGGNWQSLFTAVLKVFDDRATSIILSSTYTEYSHVVKSSDFSTEQFNFLISNEYVQQKIAELPTNEKGEILFNIETKEYKKLIWLFEKKKNINKDTYCHFFEQIIGATNAETRMCGKSVDEIAEILKFANPCIDLIPDRKIDKITTETGETIPITLYGLIVNDRKMLSNQAYANHQWWTQQHMYRKQNFIDECIAEEKYIEDIIQFVFNIYRISNNNTDVSNEIKKLMPQHSLDEDFIELINKGFNLDSPILDLIFDDDEHYENQNNFKSDDRLFLLKYCFNQKKEDKKTYFIAEDKAQTKLDALLVFAQKENSNSVYNLLETLIEQERYKTILSNLIIEKDCDFINSLPQKFLKLAVGIFTKDNYMNFADNFDFLKVIIQHGNNTQKGYVVKILIEKLDNNETIEQVLKLIDSMENVSSFDKSGLLFTHLDNYQNINKDSISEEINTEIDRLKNKIK